MAVKKSLDFNEFDGKMDKNLPDWKVPGCAVAVVKDGEAIHWKGYGFRDVEKQLPVEMNTVFAIGSTSKAFTSTAAAILVDRGLLDWDTPVKQYIPEFELWDNFAAERMTVRDLMSHRSGLPRHDSVWYGTAISRQEVFKRLKYLQPSADFRTTFQYQNLMFMAAGYLVERITGQTWEEFVQQNILDPLEMSHTTLCVEGLRTAANAALPYSSGENGFQKLPYRDLDVISPAGGINSCLEDMAKWLSIHLQGGSYNGKVIVSAENMAVTHTAVTNIENSYGRLLQPFKAIGMEQYGLGWFMHDYRGHRIIRHGGHIDGFSTQVSFMPEIGAGVIVLCNVGGSEVMFVPTFQAYDVLLGLPDPDWSNRLLAEVTKTRQSSESVNNWLASKKQNRTAPSHPLAAYAGSYGNPAYGKISIDIQEGELKAAFNGKLVQLKHYHYDTFEWSLDRPGAVPLQVNFHNDWLGNISEFEIQFEPMVDPICFEREPEPGLTAISTLTEYTGNYVWDDQLVHIELIGGTDLRLTMPGFPQMHLAGYQPGLYKVIGHTGWYVEFQGKPVNRFVLVQPASLLSALKSSL